MDWDRRRDRIGLDRKVICDIWHGLAWEGMLGLKFGPRPRDCICGVFVAVEMMD